MTEHSPTSDTSAAEVPEDLTRDLLAEYIRWIANRMGLQGWTLTLMDEPCESDALATVDPTYGKLHADIYVCHDFLDLDPVAIRASVVHELIHCHLQQVHDVLALDLKGQVTESVHAVLKSSQRRQIELATETMAHAWAPLLPLPTGEYASGQDRWWLPADGDGQGSYRCTLPHCPGPDPDDVWVAEGQSDA